MSGGVLVIVGLAFLLHNLEIVRLKQLWPVLLFVIGGGIVWKAVGSGSSALRPGDAGSGEAPSDRLDAFTFMGGVHRRTNSQSFRGGRPWR